MRSSWSRSPSSCRTASALTRRSTRTCSGSSRSPNATQCAISKGHYLAQSPKSTKSSTGYDDDYYLQRDLDGKTNKAGSLYIQAYYNKSDLSDPMTVIYGHNMANRTMFGGLQSYGETLKFDDNAVMYIYQPGRQLTYKFFACIPYDTSHILYYHDFKDEKVFNAFFEALGKAASDPKYKSDTNQNAFYSAEGCVNVDKTNLPQAGDKVVVLSIVQERRRSSPLSADGKAGGGLRRAHYHDPR